MKPIVSRGRPAAGSSDKQAAIQIAAKAAFDELGYDQASIREIAGRAGVDPKLVLHYFQSKANLFAQTIEMPAQASEAIEILAKVPRENWGAAFVDLLMQADGRFLMPHLLGVLRSATSDPKVAQTIREFYVRTSMSEAFKRLGVDHAEARAAALSPLLAGFVFADQILQIPIGTQAEVQHRRKLVQMAIQSILTAELD